MTPHFVFEAVGTRGDVAPLLEIAVELLRCGATVTVLANAVFAEEASARGIEFVATSARSLNVRGAERYERENHLYPAHVRVNETLSARDLRNAVVINIDRFSASNLACEARGVPTVRLHLSPYKIRSLVRPPWPFRYRAQGPLGETYLKHTLPRFLHACDTDARIVTYVNERRAAVGLRRIASAALPEPHVHAELALFPSWFCEPAADWPERIELLGFPFAEAHGALPLDVAQFIADHGRPIVFTPGTGFSEVSEFFDAAHDACARSGLPGIFLSPHAPAGRASATALSCVDYADLRALLPHARALVHHGGIGTTASALAAGVPQIVSPVGFDQPDNAEHTAALGVARCIPRPQLSGASLANALATLIDSAAVLDRCAAVRRRMTGASGARAVSEWLMANAPRLLETATAAQPRAAFSAGGE